MSQTLVILSGLPGTGKSTLAEALAHELCWPLLAIDDVVESIPEEMQAGLEPYWETMVSILLALVDSQLARGFSVVVDSVFMGPDRSEAAALAAKHNAAFRPIHAFISDELIWRRRLAARAAAYPDNNPATWSQIMWQRHDFWPWPAGSALMVDGLRPLPENVAAALAYVRGEKPALE